MPRSLALAIILAFTATTASADPLTVALKTGAGASAGKATLTEAPKGVLLKVEATGLTPGWHGLHFHAKADCSKADFTSAGAHTHGADKGVHGLLNAAANETGDLPNLYVGADGTGKAEMFTSLTTLKALQDADGSALVIHAAPDDHQAQPIGGAGARIACGEIK
ncbi:superoxide dismutase family protein [Phenylobacterium sp.]|jgi:Cu-Zn family superoxide dismutase|uniref:superoxide dismutase family protein n=1 Tax=Phenylobacterium sp. TaxID=1871053 RepID=UPI002ED98C6C